MWFVIFLLMLVVYPPLAVLILLIGLGAKILK